MAGYGGKRAGAGRKRTPLSRENKLGPLKRVTAEEILAEMDEKQFWIDMLTASTVISVKVIGGEDGQFEQITVPDYNTRLKAGIYVTNRRDGAPPQAIQHEIKDPVKVMLIGRAK